MKDRSLELCKSCHQCPNCCHRFTCRGRTAPVLGKMGSPGGESQGSNNTRRGLHPPLLVQAQITVINNYVNPHKNLQLLEALYQLVNKNAVESVANQTSLGFYHRLFWVPTPNNRWRPILNLEHLPKHRVVQNGDTRDNRNLPTGRGVVTSIDF